MVGKRSFVMALAVVAGVAAVAAGAVLVPLEGPYGATATYGYSLSSNGRWVGGYSLVGGNKIMSYWSPPGSGVKPYALGVRYGQYSGTDIDADGNVYSGIRDAQSTPIGYFGQNMSNYPSPGSAGNLKDWGGANSNVQVVLEGNPVATTPGNAVYMVGHDLKKYQAYIYKWQGSSQTYSPYNLVTSATGSGNGRLNLLSISKTSQYTWSTFNNVPLIVGNDRGGTGGANRPIWTHVKPVQGNNSTAKPIPYIPGAELVNGIAFGISADGNWMSGYMYKFAPVGSGTSGYRQMGFRYAWTGNGAGGASEELWPRGYYGDADKELLRNLTANVIDIAVDGTAVGWTYDSAGLYINQGPSDPIPTQTYAAYIWLPGSSEGYMLKDYLDFLGVDTSAWAWLERAESIEIVNGQLFVTGYGRLLDGSIRAFYIPEPATMALLAAGGLALLRRRR